VNAAIGEYGYDQTSPSEWRFVSSLWITLWGLEGLLCANNCTLLTIPSRNLPRFIRY
jgi:hypothetical protein